MYLETKYLKCWDRYSRIVRQIRKSREKPEQIYPCYTVLDKAEEFKTARIIGR